MKSSPSGGLKDPQSSESRIRLLRTLGFKVLSDINAVSVVMPTALIGTILLTLRGRGVGQSELVRRVEWLSDRVRSKGGRVAHFGGVSAQVVVDRGLEVLGPSLVGVAEGLAETTYYAVDRFQLSFYRNMTIHLFISEALVSAAMYTRVKRGGGPDNQRISYAALFDQVSFLSQVSIQTSSATVKRTNFSSSSAASSSTQPLASKITSKKPSKASKQTRSSHSSAMPLARSYPPNSAIPNELADEKTLISTVSSSGLLSNQPGLAPYR